MPQKQVKLSGQIWVHLETGEKNWRKGKGTLKTLPTKNRCKNKEIDINADLPETLLEQEELGDTKKGMGTL